MKKKKDIYIKSTVHTWTTNQEDQIEDWAKMLKKKLKLGHKMPITKGTAYHYTDKPRFCASAGMMEFVLNGKKTKTFPKKKRGKKK